VSFLVIFSDHSWLNTLRQMTDLSRSIPPGFGRAIALFPNSMQIDLYCQSENNPRELRRRAISLADTRQRILALNTILTFILQVSFAGIKNADSRPFSTRPLSRSRLRQMTIITCQINVQKSELELERLIPKWRASAIY